MDDILEELESDSTNKEVYMKSRTIQEFTKKDTVKQATIQDDELDIEPKKRTPAKPQLGTATETLEESFDSAPEQKKQVDLAYQEEQIQPVKLDPNEEIRRRLFKLNVATIACGAFSALIIIWCLWMANRSFDRKYFPFEGLRENWGNGIITDIRTSIDKKCPPDSFPAFVYGWPGTFEGCDCRKITGNSVPKTATQGKCSAAQKGAGCAEVPVVDNLVISRWRDPDILCLVRQPGVNFEKNLLNMETSGQCKKGFKICVDKLPKNGDVVDYSRALCIEEARPCPISDIRVAPCDANPGIDCFEDNVQDKINLAANTCLWKSRKCGPGPISSLAVSEGGYCRLSIEQQISQDHEDHPLLRFRRSRCENSENGVVADTLSMTSLLSGAQSATIDPFKIPNYKEETDKYNFNLYKVYYTRWTPPHRLQTDYDVVFNNNNYIQRLEGNHSSALAFFFVGVLVLAVGAPLLFRYELKNPGLYTSSRVLLLLKYLMIWFFKLAIIPVIVLLRKFGTDLYGRFKVYGSSKFSNEHENLKMQELAHALENGVFKWDGYALYIALLTLIVDIILLVLVCLTEKQRIKKEELDLNSSMTQELNELDTKPSVKKYKR